MTQPDDAHIRITGDGNVVGDYNTVIVYQSDRPVSVADMLDACRGQVRSMVDEARHKYDPTLYVHRAIEQELNQFFDTPLDESAANCYLIVAPAGSGKTNLLCHLAGERTETQSVVLLMGGNLYLSPTSGLLGALQSELQTANREVSFRSAEDCLHTLHRVAEETGRDALIILDAINEHDKPIEMRKAVEDLLRKTRGHRIKLVITCRDFYWGVFKGTFWESAAVNPLPAEVAEDEEGTPGSGDFNHFTVDEQEIALNLYLAHYQIVGRPIGDAVEQLRHPLLLRFFCEAYRGHEVGEVEDIRLKELFDRYWGQKLASVAERMIKGGNERVQEVLQEELGVYLMSVAAYMLRTSVRAIPEGEMPKATGLSERRGDPHTIYGRIRDEFIILEERERGQGRSKAVQVAFVYEEFMEYSMARSLLRDWEAADLNEDGILAAIDTLVAQYASFAQVLGVMVYVGLMLREQRGLALWGALMGRGRPWRGVVLEAIRKLPESQIDGNVYLVLEELLSIPDVELQTRALDLIKTNQIGQRAPRRLMETVCSLAEHEESSLRCRVVLAISWAPQDLQLSVLWKAIRDPHDKVVMSAASRLIQLGDCTKPILTAAYQDTNKKVRYNVAKVLQQLHWEPPDAATQGWGVVALQDWQRCVRLGQYAVEPLLVALRDSDRPVREAAVDALGQIGDPRAVESLATALRDSDGQVRKAAVAALRQIGDPRAVESLATALRDSDGQVRKAVVAALGQIGDPRAVESLATALRDSDGQVRKAAVAALGQIGDPRAVESLATALRDSDRGVREAAAAALTDIGSPSVGPLVQVLRDSSPDARQAAVDALVKIGSSSVGPLVEVMLSRNHDARQAAVGALARIGDVRALEPLAAALCDGDGGVRQAAVGALARIGDVRALEPLKAALCDSDETVRWRAAEALRYLGWRPGSDTEHVWYLVACQAWQECVGLGPRAVEPLLGALRNSDRKGRLGAAGALGQLKDARAMRPLLTALRDSDRGVRRAAASALKQMDWQPESSAEQGWYLAALGAWSECVCLGQNAVKPLFTALCDSDWGVRRAAAGALGQIGDVRAVEPLVTALRDSNAGVQVAAAGALGQIGDVRAVEPLVAALRDSNAGVQVAAAGALGQIGDVRAVEPLVAALRDNYYRDVRREAACALGQLEDAQAVEPLLAALRDGDEGVRQAAAGALGLLSSLTTETLAKALRALRNTDVNPKPVAVAKRGQAGKAQSAPPATVTVESYDLGFLTDNMLWPLVNALEDTTDSVRSETILTLALFEDRSIEALKSALKHKSARIRTGAQEALELIGTPAALAALAEAGNS